MNTFEIGRISKSPYSARVPVGGEVVADMSDDLLVQTVEALTGIIGEQGSTVTRWDDGSALVTLWRD